MIQGTYLIFKHIAHTLIDHEATYFFFVSHAFTPYLGVIPVSLDFALVVSTPANGNMAASIVYKLCIIEVADKEFDVDLLLLDIRDFNVILRMDWLTVYHVTVDCYHKSLYLIFLIKYLFRANKFSFFFLITCV